MRDHGGNLDRALAQYGGEATDWVDLSTGINRVHYPVPALPLPLWQALPTRAALDGLLDAARAAYGATGPVAALAGAQGAIQMIPLLLPPGRARVLAPTYNEHAAALRAAGWQVEEVSTFADLAGADLAVVVNPNNPDGRRHMPEALRDLAGHVGCLVVDESFADPDPSLSLAAGPGQAGLLVLRSFGKFYGLAGLRLGFVLGDPALVARIAGRAGPWPVSGAAIEIGRRALTDPDWARATSDRLAGEAVRLDGLASSAGWSLVGGTHLFRLYDTPDAAAAQDRLARARIWSRVFPYSARWIRLGLPGPPAEWDRLAAALG